MLGFKRKTKKQRAADAELELIIDKMGLAMRNANREWVGRSEVGLTPNMNIALAEFQDFCRRNPE